MTLLLGAALKCKIKGTLLSIMPPVMTDVAAYYRRHRSFRFYGRTFLGVFESFQEIDQRLGFRAAYNSSASEEHERINIQRVKHLVKELETGFIPQNHPRMLVLSLMVSLMDKDEITILDIGGGAALARLYVSYHSLGKMVNLEILELPAVAAMGNEVFKDDPRINFHADLSTLKTKEVDIVFFGGSLQYFENYYAMLDATLAFNTKYVAIIETELTDARDFSCAQVNMPGRVIPNKIINQAALLMHMKDKKFELIFKNVDTTVDYFDQFDFPYNQTKATDLIFRSSCR